MVWSSVTYGNDKFVAIANGYYVAAYSIDGINWIRMSLPRTLQWKDVTYGDGKFVAVARSSQYAAYSTDCINWTETVLPKKNDYVAVTYGDGKFVAIADETHEAAYSTDGINWMETVIPRDEDWCYVTYGDGKFVAISDSKYATYSTDGINWIETVMPFDGNWRSITYGDGKFVATAESKYAAYSTDGINWTETVMPRDSDWLDVTYGDGKFVAVSGYSSQYAAYSTDGISWTETVMPFNDDWTIVTYGDGKFVAVVVNSQIMAYSTDGINWKIDTAALIQNEEYKTEEIRSLLLDGYSVPAPEIAKAGQVMIVKAVDPITNKPTEWEPVDLLYAYRPNNCIVLRDETSGYEYIVNMQNGNLASSCKLANIQVTTAPTKTDYIDGELFDKTGMIITATYYDGTTKVIDNYTHDKYVLSGKDIIIRYEEYGIVYATTISASNFTIVPFDPAIHLIDFNYSQLSDNFYLSSWKHTLNGEPSTEMIIPNHPQIVLW